MRAETLSSEKQSRSSVHFSPPCLSCLSCCQRRLLVAVQIFPGLEAAVGGNGGSTSAAASRPHENPRQAHTACARKENCGQARYSPCLPSHTAALSPTSRSPASVCRPFPFPFFVSTIATRRYLAITDFFLLYLKRYFKLVVHFSKLTGTPKCARAGASSGPGATLYLNCCCSRYKITIKTVTRGTKNWGRLYGASPNWERYSVGLSARVSKTR